MQTLLDSERLRPILPSSLYEYPELYDHVVCGPCEPFYLEQTARANGPVLELGCGTGRVALALAASGKAVTGLDLSPSMLAATARKADQKNLSIRLTLGDMRRFNLGSGAFGAVIAPINTLLHLETLQDLKSCFDCVRRHLSEDGVFAFDVFNPQIARLAQNSERHMVGRFVSAHGDEILLEETLRYDATRQVLRGVLYFSSPERPDFHIAPMNLRCVFPQELPLLLESTGFVLAERRGGFQREPFTDDSVHQVCVARPA